MHVVPSSWNTPDPLQQHSSPLQLTARDGSNNNYLIDKGHKLYLGPTPQWPVGTPTTNAPFALTRLTRNALSDIYLSDDGEIIYSIPKPKACIPSMDDFFGLVLTCENRKVTNSAKNLPGMSYGGYHLAENRLVRKTFNWRGIYHTKRHQEVCI